jgi:hypothetical protein
MNLQTKLARTNEEESREARYKMKKSRDGKDP